MQPRLNWRCMMQNGNIICGDTDIIGYCITNKGYNPNFDSKQVEELVEFIIVL